MKKVLLIITYENHILPNKSNIGINMKKLKNMIKHHTTNTAIKYQENPVKK